MAKKMSEVIYCVKCNKRMGLGLLPSYEYEEGLPLRNVETYQCPKCNNLFFTEEQAKEMEERTTEEYSFGFDRKVTISGKSLVVGIPAELAQHMNLRQGQKVRIIPIAKEGFMIRKAN